MTTATKGRGIPDEIDREGRSDDEVASATRGHVRRIALIAALGGLLYGYDTGVISGTLISIGKDFGIGNGVKQLITAAILAGAVLGAFCSSWLSRRIGRRRTIMIVAAVFVLGVVFAGLSPGPTTLVLSRLFLGLAVGGSTQVIPTYVAELSPRERRGRMVTLFSCAIGIGILSAAFVNVALDDVLSWRWLIMLSGVPAIVLLLGMFVLPESPRWLVHAGRDDDAGTVLRWVRRSPADAGDELDDIRSVADREQNGGTGGGAAWSQLRERWVRPALVAGVGVAILTQITGLEMMIYYTPTILTQAGFPHAFALWANVGVGAVYLLMTFIGSRLVDRIGRRRLPLLTLPFSAASLAAFGALFLFGGDHLNPVLSLLFLLLFMFFQSGGLQVIGWLLESELYPLTVRPAATSLQAMTLWGSDLLVTVTALTLVLWLGLGGAMWVYAGLNVVAWVFIFFRLPETKNRSLEDIERSLRDGVFLPRVGRRKAARDAEGAAAS
ncbi:MULTISPECIES: sugar porter family MFS transporter [unclassified Curtobacterium]|uniref:sugar porter family MFS transporter n=1 Tax=unclassified Curtobacterium TaxID=257496 RepID=UPI001C64DF4F|nr:MULTISPECIES: sugar porter family MFS transporter [unclassified Curtobacterium]